MINGFPEKFMGTFFSVSFTWYQHPLRKFSLVCFYDVIAHHIMTFC